MMNDADKKNYETMLSRTDLISAWLELGVFWDSIVDPAESVDLGPLPELSGLTLDDLWELFYALKNLKSDLMGMRRKRALRPTRRRPCC